MSACLAEDFSVNYFDRVPSQSRQPFRAADVELTPAQSLLESRNNTLIEATVSALDEASAEKRAVEVTAISNLSKLLRLLPPTLPPTTAHISASGALCFDWDENPDNQLSIILQADNRVAFAAYFDGVQDHGTDPFDLVLPERLAIATQKWIERERAA